MLSYTQRRRRWWSILRELDPSLMISDGLRMELLLELSGLSRQEALVVRACAKTKDFEGICEVLVEQYGGVHLREGSRSWLGRAPQMNSYKGKGKYPSTGKDKDSERQLTSPMGKMRMHRGKMLMLLLGILMEPRIPLSLVCLEMLMRSPMTRLKKMSSIGPSKLMKQKPLL